MENKMLNGGELVVIKKEVVLDTNKPEINYICMSEKKFKEIGNNRFFIELKTYQNKQDKKNKIIFEHSTIEVFKVQKMGVKSYNRKNPEKNIHRYKIIHNL